MSNQVLAQMLKAVTPTIMPSQGGILQRACACGNHTDGGGECAECRKKRGVGMLQRAALQPSAFSPHPSVVPPIVHEVLRSPGQPLDAETRAFMEPRFGHDFSRVRVHTDTKAAESARAVNALAYDVGRDVVFGAGQYAPSTSAGRQLMAHELTHVVQQAPFAAFSGSPIVGDAGDSYEVEAEQVAAGITEDMGESVSIRQTGSGDVLRRFSSGEHELIGKEAYDKAYTNIQAASTGLPAPAIDESFVRELRSFNFRTKGGRAFTYGQVVAEADNVASFEMMEDERLRRASNGVNIPIISPLLNPVWDWIGDNTHYLDLAARNRAHFHPHNYLSYQPWHWQALKTMNRAWQFSQQANQIQREVRALLNRYDAEDRRGRQALAELDALDGQNSPRTSALERVVDSALNQMTALLAQARRKQEQYQQVRTQANNQALRAMAMNGFSDHFLTDAFAAGHIVTPRKELLDEYTTRFLGVIPVGGVLKCSNIPSLAWHDLDNMYGVQVDNLNGDTWLTYGDDYADKDTPKGRSLSPTLEHVVDSTAASIGQMWQAAGGQIPSDLMPVLKYIPRPTWDHYPGWNASEWDRQLRFAAGEQIGANYDAMSATPPGGSEKPAETVPNPKGHAIGSGLLSARATCLNLMSEFSYDDFVVPMLVRVKTEYNQRYFTGAPGQITSPDEKPVAQESGTGHVVLGSILGGLGGALGGALLGGLIGGPIGAIIGGVIGLAAGFLAGGFIGGLTGKRRDETPAIGEG
jgi:hypothetical protein